jgi:glutamyl-Q tRNA(Asp) synthetase
VTDANGNKLSKSDAAHPVDAADPLPALREAWRGLGQDPAVLAASSTVAVLLAAARAGFDPSRIPPRSASAASHNTSFTIRH